MLGFSFKSIVLQIIQGGVILITFFDLCKRIFEMIIVYFSKSDIVTGALFLGIAYILGVLIDSVSDLLEVGIIKTGWIKPPSYYLLKNGSLWGISLAHYDKIKNELFLIAGKFCPINKKIFELSNVDFNNLLFQTAKNIAFKNCSEYQKAHLESFFILYVFCRNLALYLMIVLIYLIVCWDELTIFAIPNTIILLLLLISSYRYFIYYTRMILGATFTPQ